MTQHFNAILLSYVARVGIFGLVDAHCLCGALAVLFCNAARSGQPDQRVLATLMRDVPDGQWLRIAHANGASLFFLVVYVHTVHAFYYSSWSS